MDSNFFWIKGFPAADVPDWFDEIRESGPIARHEITGSWYITRFEDVWGALVDSRLGARESGPSLDAMTEEQRAGTRRLREFVNRWPLFLNPPVHTAARRMLLPSFSQASVDRAVHAAQSHMEAAYPVLGGDEIISALIRPSCEAALAALLEVDLASIRDLSRWSSDIMAFVGLNKYEPGIVAKANNALDGLSDFVRKELPEGKGLLPRILGAARTDGDDGDADVAGAVAIYAQLMTGAFEPTISAVVVALEMFSSSGYDLASFRSGSESAINEAMRLATPFHFAPRCASEDLVLHGVRIAKGERVTLALLAANRDPRQFTKPAVFNPNRANARNVAFGRGRHACLGARLANELLRAVIDHVMARSNRATLPAFDVRWDWYPGMHLPVACTVADQAA